MRSAWIRSLSGLSQAGFAVCLLTVLGSAVGFAQETRTPVFSSPDRAFPRSELAAASPAPRTATWLSRASSRSATAPRTTASASASSTGVRTPAWSPEVSCATASFATRTASPSTGRSRWASAGVLSEGDGDELLIPAGVSIGRRIPVEGSNVSFTPYAQPLLVTRVVSGELELDVAVGLGVDVRIGHSFDVRVAGGLGEIEGISFSVAWLN